VATNSKTGITLAEAVSERSLQALEMPYARICGSTKDDIERLQCTTMEFS